MLPLRHEMWPLISSLFDSPNREAIPGVLNNTKHQRKIFSRQHRIPTASWGNMALDIFIIQQFLISYFHLYNQGTKSQN